MQEAPGITGFQAKEALLHLRRRRGSPKVTPQGPTSRPSAPGPAPLGSWARWTLPTRGAQHSWSGVCSPVLPASPPSCSPRAKRGWDTTGQEAEPNPWHFRPIPSLPNRLSVGWFLLRSKEHVFCLFFFFFFISPGCSVEAFIPTIHRTREAVSVEITVNEGPGACVAHCR